MDATGFEILQLKFEGNGISPSSVRPSDIAELIKNFEDALLSIVSVEYPQIDRKYPLFTFEEIKNESIGLSFSPNKTLNNVQLRKWLVNSYIALGAVIANGSYQELSNETIKPLRSISKFTKKHSCNATFVYNGKSIGSISPNTEIKLNKDSYLKGDTTIFGELLDSGGDNPNIHVKINDDYIVIIDTDKQKAKELGSRLYDQVGLKGFAKWDILTSKIIEFKLYEILDYTQGNAKKTIDEIKGITSGFWDNFDSNEEINNNLFRD